MSVKSFGSADLLRGMINNNAKLTSADLTGQVPEGPSS